MSLIIEPYIIQNLSVRVVVTKCSDYGYTFKDVVDQEDVPPTRVSMPWIQMSKIDICLTMYLVGSCV